MSLASVGSLLLGIFATGRVQLEKNSGLPYIRLGAIVQMGMIVADHYVNFGNRVVSAYRNTVQIMVYRDATLLEGSQFV